MKVICVGMSRTGTKTLTAALRQLGYNVYDFEEHGLYHAEKWIDIMERGWKVEDFKQMYKDADAVVAYPIYCFWEEFMEAFPEAKVILTKKDPDEWVESVIKIMKVWRNRSYLQTFGPYFSKTAWNFREFEDAGDCKFFGNKPYRFYSPDLLKKNNLQHNRKMFIRHNALIKYVVPKDKLMVFNVAEGWKPLCEFLDEKIPDGQFPHLNKGAVMMKNVQNEILYRKIKNEVFWSLTFISTGVAVCVGGAAILYTGKWKCFVPDNYIKLLS